MLAHGWATLMTWWQLQVLIQKEASAPPGLSLDRHPHTAMTLLAADARCRVPVPPFFQLPRLPALSSLVASFLEKPLYPGAQQCPVHSMRLIKI